MPEYCFKQYIDQLNSEGVAVIPNFINNDEINEIKNEMKKIIKNIDFSAHRKIFCTGTNQPSILDQYFRDSVDKISYFFEKDAFDSNGNLIIPEEESINKIGHCLHMKNNVFKKITFSDKVKELIKQLGYIKPLVPQSMYIFKNGNKVGGPVVPHKGTYLFTEGSDLKLTGLWIPLVDVNEKNGCLYYRPKSHLNEERKLLVRDENDRNKFKNINQELEKVYPDEEYLPIEVKAGSLVLIHGLVNHQSKYNETNEGRPIYTFHLLDLHNKKWSDKNWLQETDEYKFPNLFDTQIDV